MKLSRSSGKLKSLLVASSRTSSGRRLRRSLRGEAAGLQADIFLDVGVDDVVLAVIAVAAGLAEGHLGACDVLELDRDVLQDMAHPGAFVLGQPTHEPAGLAVGAAMLVEPWKGLEQAAGEGFAQFR